MRTAVALNSEVPDFGSTASMVSSLVATWSGKWKVMNASPGRSPASRRTGATTEPRREITRTGLARRDPQARGRPPGAGRCVSPRRIGEA